MKDYAEYSREFVMDWTQKISLAAGVAQGKGKRGKMKMDELCEKLAPGQEEFRTKWMRWKAGSQTPSRDIFMKIHDRAVDLGYLGQEKTLRAIRERAPMMSKAEWEFWNRYEANPSFVVDDQEEELRERLVVLEREAAAARRFLHL